MILQQEAKDFEKMASLLILTNGTSSVFKKYNVIFLQDVPLGLIIDMTAVGHRISIGGRLFYKLLSFTNFRIGTFNQIFQNTNVKKGDVWYLTMAEYYNKPDEELKIAFKSLLLLSSMELVQLDRHTNMNYYSAMDNEFEGRYFGFKFPFLPFGFSIARNLEKEIKTSKGSVVYFCSIGHAKGKIEVSLPNNKTYVNTNKRMALFEYCGNQTGNWKFFASGVGFPWKHFVVLFYVDVDPHIKSTI
jgi:hypothetical protein